MRTYAVCEGICRRLDGVPVSDLPTAAATHVAACLAYQRRNLETWGGHGAFFTYEAMCEEPRVACDIQALVPALDDLELRQRLRVHREYDEILVDMNPRQLARLSAERIAAFNRVFRQHRDLLDYFGYELIEGTMKPGPSTAC